MIRKQTAFITAIFILFSVKDVGAAVTASSIHPDPYQPGNALDGNPKTCGGSDAARMPAASFSRRFDWASPPFVVF